jgi:hypothetical protein
LNALPVDRCGDRRLYFALVVDIFSGNLGVSMATNLEVRVLLVLWEFGDKAIAQGLLNKQIGGKDTADKNKAREKLIETGAIIEVSTPKKVKAFTLTDLGTTLLAKSLVEDGFLFEGKTMGTKIANVLLKWVRSQPKHLSAVKAAVSAIESYEAFKVVALEVYDRLNKEHVHSGLVPIWQARQEIGNALSRTQFNDWIMQMQAEQIFYLQTGEALGATESQKRDSLETDIRGLLFYISQPN